MKLQAGKEQNLNYALQKFNFRPDSEDVGKNLEVEKVIIGLGHSNPGGLKMNLNQMIPKVFSNSNFPL